MTGQAEVKPVVRSMTGFARQEATQSWGTLAWEIRSVNHRYLESSFRLPEALRPLEPTLRQQLRHTLQRGKVELQLRLELDDTAKEESLDLERLHNLDAALQKVEGTVAHVAPANAMDILQWPGVIRSRSPDEAALREAVLENFGRALDHIVAHREREGAELAAAMENRLAGIEKEVAAIRPWLPEIHERQRRKLLERIGGLGLEVNDERLEQELVFYAQKTDMDEELDRLLAHVAEARRALADAGPIGRRLDFLMQELNREANTVASKSVSVEVSRASVELKLLIEQIREQAQNIE